MRAWIGVDLDGTLAEHYWPEKGQYDPYRIGDPVTAMVARVRQWTTDGMLVKVFTARVDGGEVALAMGEPLGEVHRDVAAITRTIEAWCQEHIGFVLPVTCRKDYGMVELWDDRAVRVICNTGERCCGA